jgi:hypothetical protein
VTPLGKRCATPTSAGEVASATRCRPTGHTARARCVPAQSRFRQTVVRSAPGSQHLAVSAERAGPAISYGAVGWSDGCNRNQR